MTWMDQWNILFLSNSIYGGINCRGVLFKKQSHRYLSVLFNLMFWFDENLLVFFFVYVSRYMLVGEPAVSASLVLSVMLSQPL